jgi:hypothetical protein
MHKWLPLLCLLVSAAPASAQTASATLAWDANTEPDLVGYVVQSASQSGGPYHDSLTTTEIAASIEGLQPGTRYYFVVRAINALELTSTPSNEVSATTPGLPLDDCAPVTGRYAVSVFPTSLLRTGSGGPGSKTRFDFQVASPSAPVTSVAVYADGAQLAAMKGDDITALAGMWFPMPPSGTYTLSIAATNEHGCTKRVTYGLSLIVP